MSKNQRKTARKPATKFAHLQKKMQKQKVQGKKSRKKFYFYEGKEKSFESEEEEYEKKGTNYCNMELDVKHYFDKGVEARKGIEF